MYKFLGGLPYLEASYFELNAQTSPEDWYAASASPKKFIDTEVTIVWNTAYLERAVAGLTEQKAEIQPELRAHFQLVDDLVVIERGRDECFHS